MKLIIALVLSLGVYCAQAKEPYRVIDSKEIELRGDASYEIGAANPFTGSVVAHGPGGQKLLEQSIVNGKPEGATTVWYPDGKKGREIYTADGVPAGVWTHWNFNGNIKVQLTFVDGEKQSTHNVWYENGQQRSERNFICRMPIEDDPSQWNLCRQATVEMLFAAEWEEDGELTGTQTEWYENGRKKSRTTTTKEYVRKAINGVKINTLTETVETESWYENGQKENRQTHEQIDLLVPQSGTETWYAFEEKSWHANGKISSHRSMTTGNGFRHEWDENGKKVTELRWEGYLDSGTNRPRQTGFEGEIALSGLRTETNYVDGKRHGVATRWWPDGLKESQWSYVNGLHTGNLTAWHRNGQIAREQKLVDGRLPEYLGVLRLAIIEAREDAHFEWPVGERDTVLVTAWHANGQKAFEGAFMTTERRAERYSMERRDTRNEFLADPTDPTGNKGFKAGVHTEWHDNGQKRSEINAVVRFQHEMPRGSGCGDRALLCSSVEGLAREWDENGQIEKELCFLYNRAAILWGAGSVERMKIAKDMQDIEVALDAAMTLRLTEHGVREGTADEIVWREAMLQIKDVLRDSKGQQAWEELRERYPDDLREAVDKINAETPATDDALAPIC